MCRVAEFHEFRYMNNTDHLLEKYNNNLKIY